MKRHLALQPLSREHHKGLLLAQLLRMDVPDYKGMPTDTKGKIVYAVKSYQEELDHHFQKEEALLAMARSINVELDLLIDEILKEHALLRKQFNSLNTNSTTREVLHELGMYLSDHIRKEERILFPLLENCCSENLLDSFRQML
jgi:hemerythrin-like domain-containing protein